MKLDVIILAAGHGKRMHSTLPKVLHKLADKPLLQYIVETVKGLNPNNIYVVYGNGGNQVLDCLGHLAVHWVKQTELLGTGHAVAQALLEIKQDESQLLILLGDTPLVSLKTLQKLLHTTNTHQMGLITLTTTHPFGLGRILRDQYGKVIQIVEEKEATPEQKKIKEVNSGIFYVPVKLLRRWLPKIKKMNAQGEYYLTDIITMAVEEKIEIVTLPLTIDGEMQGVNDRVQLAKLERFFQQSAAEKLMLSGVTIRDPNRFDLRGKLVAEKDVIIDIDVILEGKNTIGANSLLVHIPF